MGTKGLLKFLNSLTEEKTNKFPHLNKSLNNKELLKLNMEQKSILDATGLIETHRLFWNKRNNQKFEEEIWSKLRSQHKIRRKLSYAENNNYDSFLGTDLYSYLIELDDNYIKSWVRILKSSDNWSEFYNNNFNNNNYYPENFVQRIFHSTKPVKFLDQNFENKRILDLGCGYGRNIPFLINLGFKVNGIEISPALVKNLKNQIS